MVVLRCLLWRAGEVEPIDGASLDGFVTIRFGFSGIKDSVDFNLVYLKRIIKLIY